MEANVVTGSRAEFCVLVGDRVAVKKGWFLFPKDAVILSAVRQGLAAAA
ncbi:MAG: hypothetical protein HYY24_01610 [Verrucomicrobia bacterium]|nr:hypothetical protein [Verrucomicrobiota bacterium]